MACHEQLVHCFHCNNNKSRQLKQGKFEFSFIKKVDFAILPISLAIYVPAGLLIQVLSDPVEFFRRAERIKGELFHVSFDESILGIYGEDVVHQSLVSRS